MCIMYCVLCELCIMYCVLFMLPVGPVLQAVSQGAAVTGVFTPGEGGKLSSGEDALMMSSLAASSARSLLMLLRTGTLLPAR